MGGREAGSRHKEPLGNRVTVRHKANAAVEPLGRDSAHCRVAGVTVAQTAVKQGA